MNPCSAAIMEILRAWSAPGAQDRELALRAGIVLMSQEGHSAPAIARAWRTSASVALKWRRRFAAKGLRGLRRPDGLPECPELRRDVIREMTLACLGGPAPAGQHGWSVPAVSRALGFPKAAVREIMDGEKLLKRREQKILGRTEAARSRPEADLAELELWAGGGAPDGSSASRAAAVLMVVDGRRIAEAARKCGREWNTVCRWIDRFAAAGAAGLRRPRLPGLPPVDAAELLARAGRAREKSMAVLAERKDALARLLATSPPAGRTCWRAASAARALGISRHEAIEISSLCGQPLEAHPPELEARLDEEDSLAILLATPPPKGRFDWTYGSAARALGVSTRKVVTVAMRSGLRPMTRTEEKRARSEARHEARHTMEAEALASLLATPPPRGKSAWRPGTAARALGLYSAKVIALAGEMGITLASAPSPVKDGQKPPKL
jgi:transposase